MTVTPHEFFSKYYFSSLTIDKPRDTDLCLGSPTNP